MVKVTGRVKLIDLGTENGAISANSNLRVLGSNGVFLDLSVQVPTEVAYQLKLMDEVELTVDFPNLKPAAPAEPAPAPEAQAPAAQNIES